jgi:hypothetical protein
MPDRPPAQVLRFLQEQIDTVSQLEALLLMWQTSPDGWRVSDLAARIYVSTEETRKILRALAKRDLVREEEGETGIWRFNPQCHDAALLPEVSASYRIHLIFVSRLIHSKGSLAVREFARAFRFTEEPDK